MASERASNSQPEFHTPTFLNGLTPQEIRGSTPEGLRAAFGHVTREDLAEVDGRFIIRYFGGLTGEQEKSLPGPILTLLIGARPRRLETMAQDGQLEERRRGRLGWWIPRRNKMIAWITKNPVRVAVIATALQGILFFIVLRTL